MPHYTPDSIALGIIAEGERRGVTEKGICIAISTGLVETNLVMYANHADPESLNYPHDAIGSDANSVGVFQQRHPWWGTCYDRMHVEPSAEMFFAELIKQDYNSDAHSPGWYAQQVQQSAYPDRYDERYPEACDIYHRLKGQATGEPPVEKMLPYDRGIVVQETYFNCGPASTQIVLNSAGIIVSEQELANSMGTDEGGTDHVGLIEDTLDRYVPDAQFAEVYLHIDPPTPEQKEDLWDHLVNSIDCGWGVVCNWVAPPSNYPRGVKGSTSPAYGGGTVYHYVAAMGYDSDPSLRAVWIADSGFSPYGYWCAFDQVATLIPPKGYTYSALTPPEEAEIVDDIGKQNYEQLCGPVNVETGYGTGWPQLGTNEHGQYLYVVDAVGKILAMVENREAPAIEEQPSVGPQTALDYPALTLDQLAGPKGQDGVRHGWEQLGNRTLTDAIAHIKATLEGGEPPLSRLTAAVVKSRPPT